MTREELLKAHERQCRQDLAIMAGKNADYAGQKGDDPFGNFKLAEYLGVAKTEAAMFVRFCDKVSRIATFLRDGSYAVKGESFRDSLSDARNYLHLLEAWMDEKEQLIADVAAAQPVEVKAAEKSNLEEVLAGIEVSGAGIFRFPTHDAQEPWAVYRADVASILRYKRGYCNEYVSDLWAFLKSKGWNEILPPDPDA